MHWNRWRWGLRFVVMAAALLVLVSLVVMYLWNWFAAPLFGRPEIGLVQAAGLLLLCRILFGGLRGYAGMHWRRRLAQRWEQMSPEERERFRAGMRGCCGRAATSGPESGSPATTS